MCCYNMSIHDSIIEDSHEDIWEQSNQQARKHSLSELTVGGVGKNCPCKIIWNSVLCFPSNSVVWGTRAGVEKDKSCLELHPQKWLWSLTGGLWFEFVSDMKFNSSYVIKYGVASLVTNQNTNSHLSVCWAVLGSYSCFLFQCEAGPKGLLPSKIAPGI